MLRQGQNGYADVFLVEEEAEQRKVVLKLYQNGRKPKDTNALDVIQRVTAIKKDVLHLVPLLEYGWYKEPETGAERFYELQEYMDGGSLDGLPNNTSADTLFTIVKSVCKGLYLLHKACGIRHGDIKISNLFLTNEGGGRVLIGDFDCAVSYGIGSKDSGAFAEDWSNVADMFRRFNVMKKDKSFEELIKLLDIKGCDWEDVAEWIGKYEHHHAADGKKDVSYLPLEVIASLAELDALRYGCERQKMFHGFIFSTLLSNSGLKDQQEWAQHCLIEAPTTHTGCAPYSDYLAAWKFVAGLKSEDQPPVFKIGDKLISKPEDLKSRKIDKTLVRDSLRNGHLKDWIAIFYHQNPWRSFTKNYEYEREVERYLDFIRSLDSQDVNVKRLDEARSTIKSGTNGMTNWKWGIWFTQAVCGLLFAIPALLFLWWMIFHGLPFDGNPFSPTIGGGVLLAGCIIGGILYFFIKDDAGSNGCGCLIAGVVGAAFFGLIFYLILKFIAVIMAVLPWICVILMLALGTLVYFIIFRDDLKIVGSNSQNDPDMWIVQPLYYAFDTSQQGYDYRQESTYDGLSDQYRNGLKKMVLQMILPILLAWGAWWGYKAISPELGGKKIVTIEERLTKYAGEWSGTFDDKPATMQILSTRPDSFSLSMTVKYQNEVTQTFTGKLEGLFGLTLDNDTPDDTVLDGGLDISLSYDHPDSFHGKYKNYTTEKTCRFSFKKIKAENDSVQ